MVNEVNSKEDKSVFYRGTSLSGKRFLKLISSSKNVTRMFCLAEAE